jgi:hypothetical protein
LESFFLSFPVNTLKMAEAENGQAISAGKINLGGLTVRYKNMRRFEILIKCGSR